MGNIGDTITETAPAVGTSGPGYATTINAILTELRARLIKKIPMSALLTNSDLDLNGHALLNAAYITLLDESVSPSGVLSPTNRIAAFDGNLWWISPEGALQISDGPNLNASGVGGITGDYSGAGPMEFRYDLANTRYDAFANQSTNTFAYVRARGFDIAGGATSTKRARLISNVANNIDLTLTESLGDTGVLRSTAGVIEASEAGVDQVTETFFTEHFKTYSALDLFTRGYFQGAGTGAIAFDGNDCPYYRLDTAGGNVMIQVHLDTETTVTNPQNTLLVTGISWKGLINGGGYPTLDLLSQTSGHPPFNTTAPAVNAETLGAQTTASGAMQTVHQDLDTPFEFLGDEMLYARVTAGTNNLDTYSITIHLTKQT